MDGTGWARDELARMLVRHQWVRDHGTPRVSLLAGPPVVGAARWQRWAELAGRAPASLWRAPRAADPAWLGTVAGEAVSITVRAPARPVAIACPEPIVSAFLRARRDRTSAMLREGLVSVPEAEATSPRLRSPRARAGAARSQAELTLYEALEATPATRGKFRLNDHMPVRFGPDGAEVDLLARSDAIAIEIDGYHHFRDADAYRRDRRKDLLLQTRGLCVLRFLADDVLADCRPALRAVLEVLAQRRREKGPR